MNHPNTRHGHASRGRKTPTYLAWESMIRRCEMPSQESYPLYGGRGIKVCTRWHDFAAFLADVGEKPAGMSLDRIDGSRGYEPGNCRWATMKQQQRNRRGNRFLEHCGERLTVAEWAERVGVPSATIRSRIDRYGWTVERALTEPYRTRAQAAAEANRLRWRRPICTSAVHQG